MDKLYCSITIHGTPGARICRNSNEVRVIVFRTLRTLSHLFAQDSLFFGLGEQVASEVNIADLEVQRFVVIGANARERAYLFLKGFELGTETLDTLQTSDRYLVD